MTRSLKTLIALGCLATLAACGPEPGAGLEDPGYKGDPPADPVDNDPPLSAEQDVLPEGIPDNPEPPATDDDPPAKGYFLLNQPGQEPLQSKVQSQGSRGVCSIFANIAYAEHLLLKARLSDPRLTSRIPATIDLSEQYLQWSVKFEVGSFPKSSGSNSTYNLRALADYGVVAESVWPYETSEWSTANDPACDGTDSQPTWCYTNGHPADAVKAAPKYRLPPSRWLSARSIRQHIYETESAAVVGLKFFYQAWNHRTTRLKPNSSYWSKGYVLYPNDADKQDSSGDRSAGHGILIVGWDDTLEVPVVDGEGKATCTDTAQTKIFPQSGSCPQGSGPVTEKGFYLFKNSWGTGKFGKDSGIGDGYGYISQRYVHEFADARVTELPDARLLPPEDGGDTQRSQTFSGTATLGQEPELYRVPMATGAHEIVVQMTGSGDADLYTRFGAAPDPTAGQAGYDCRPYESSSDETCSYDVAAGSTLYLIAAPYDEVSDYEITVTWKE